MSERLSDVGKVKVVVEFGGGPDLSDFDSSMVRGRRAERNPVACGPGTITRRLRERRAGFL